MDLSKLKERTRQIVGKFKYVFLILVVGIVLMLIPEGKSTPSVPEQKSKDSEITQMQINQGLSELLSHMAGAGQTQVLLTIRQGEQIVYQTDEDTTASEQSNDSRTQTVTITDGDRNQSGLIRQINPPIYLGAVVLCQGADDPVVCLAIVDAVSKATGLGANQISVLKMN